MATYTVRGTSHSIVYWYTGPEGRKQHWETYAAELEAMQRKAFIDYLQKTKQEEQLYKAALEYKQKRAGEKAAQEAAAGKPVPVPAAPANESDDNTRRTYREFAEKWLPYHARKKRFSPNTYDSYTGNLRNHILPYFGDRVMNGITAEDIDNFMDYLSRKPCRGGKTRNAAPGDIPMLSSAVVKKCYNILSAGFRVAKKWHYVTEIPETTAPAEKWKKRKAWEPPQVQEFLAGIQDNKLLHLIVHIAFVCSLRAGEVAGIEAERIDFDDRSMWILQQVQRVSDAALERNKAFFGPEYQDYGLLICQPDGRPLDPNIFARWFKDEQAAQKLEDQIEFQGLRKSGQMHKVRLTKNNYQLVAENSGQSPEVLMSNYNEALESEKRALSQLVESSFYPQATPPPDQNAEEILQAIRGNPALSQQILQVLLSNAANIP